MNILELAILKKMVGGGGSGTDNYNDLSNLPQINGETLAGNKTAENLGLQDALTFDSAPTEDSTNPVESGGVYNALAGKQDNLTFDGVYNASTNKAATESTVTNAIAGLDVSAFSVDADETISSISETDGKINVTKQDIAIASNQVTAMTGYTKPSSAPATPAIQTSDTANQAFGKLEFKADTNQTNILYALETGANNLCPESQLTIISNSKTKSLTVNLPAGKYYISCNATLAGNILADGVLKNSAGTAIGTASGFANGANVKSITIADTATEFYFYSTDANASFDNLMIVPEVVWNAIDHNFRTAAISNADLTKLEAEDRAGLIECVDEGAKNRLSSNISDIKAVNTSSAIVWASNGCTLRGITFVINDDKTISISGTATDIVTFRIPAYNLKNGSVYVISGCPASGSVGTYSGRTVSTDGTVLYELYDYGTGASFTADRNAICYEIRIANGYAVGGTPLIFKPMLCTEADWNISHKYAPPALPNYDLTRLEAEDRASLAEVVDSGAKNRIDLSDLEAIKALNTYGSWNGNVYTYDNSTTFTFNEDGTIGVATVGTIQSQAGCNLIVPTTLINGEEYVISGCPAGGSSGATNGYMLDYQYNRGGSIYYILDTGDGARFTYSSSDSVVKILIIIRPQTNISSGLVFKPMICTEEAWKISQNYAPYALPNTDLTRLEAEDRAALVPIADNGLKNYLNFTSLGAPESNRGKSVLVNGVRFTVNDDYTITVNRESASNELAVVTLALAYNSYVNVIDHCDSNHYLVGCPSGGGEHTYRLYAASGSYFKADTGNGALLVTPTPAQSTMYISIAVYEGYNVQNLVFKPMIIDKSVYDAGLINYQPFARSNYQLTPKCFVCNMATTATESVLSDYTIFIPKYTMAKIHVFLNYNESIPKSVTLSLSNDSSTYRTQRNLIATKERTSDDNDTFVTISHFIANGGADVTMYVWAASLASGTNRIAIVVEYIGEY
ncbi:MAG: hypothetical protein IIW48_13435 [Clostridia bacterium]|nr:hypothetical protein [Clostridia bacterium]